VKVTCSPVVHRDEYGAPLEKEIVAYLDETIFAPLRALLPAPARLNALPKKEHSAVWDALFAGTIWYAAGKFLGAFNAAISRELRAMGAVRLENGFALPIAEVPIVLRGVISYSVLRNVSVHKGVVALIERMQEHIGSAPTGLEVSDTVDKVVKDLQSQLVRTVSEVEGLPTPNPVPGAFVEQAREKLSTSTIREIKNFSLEQLQTLRAKVQQNLSGGGRVDRLAKVIETEFGVAKRKARIIAEAETSHLTADFRKDRYLALGATEYVWSTSHDEKVRPTHGESNNHRVLDGRRFAWSSPPVVDTATGRRRHPGEDYGPCRCVARPVFNL
jgi:SPP1 gp7 family putative phage head morphogenesis protein